MRPRGVWHLDQWPIYKLCQHGMYRHPSCYTPLGRIYRVFVGFYWELLLNGNGQTLGLGWSVSQGGRLNTFWCWMEIFEKKNTVTGWPRTVYIWGDIWSKMNNSNVLMGMHLFVLIYQKKNKKGREMWMLWFIMTRWGQCTRLQNSASNW